MVRLSVCAALESLASPVLGLCFCAWPAEVPSEPAFCASFPPLPITLLFRFTRHGPSHAKADF